MKKKAKEEKQKRKASRLGIMEDRESSLQGSQKKKESDKTKEKYDPSANTAQMRRREMGLPERPNPLH